MKKAGRKSIERSEQKRAEKKAEEYAGKPVLLVDITQSADDLNRILEDVAEEYIGFVDPDAVYDESYFRNLMKGFAFGKIGAVSGLLKCHNGNPVQVFQGKPKKVLRWNADKDASQFILLPYGAVFRMDIIRAQHLRFDDAFRFCRDELFAMQYIQAAPRSIIFTDQIYRTGIELDESSDSTRNSNEKDWYFDSGAKLMEKLTDAAGRLAKTSQFGMLYLTIQRFRSNQGNKIKMAFDSTQECDIYLEQVGDVMRRIDDDVLFSRGKAVAWERYKKIYLAQLRNPAIPLSYRIETDKEDAYLYLNDSKSKQELCKISEQYLVVSAMHIRENAAGEKQLHLLLRLDRCFPPESYTICLIHEREGEATEYPAKWTTQLAGLIAIFDKDAARRDAFEVSIPLDPAVTKQSVHAEISVGGVRIRKNLSFSNGWQSRLNSKDPYGYWYTGTHILQSPDGSILIRKAGEEDRRKAEETLLAHMREVAEGKPGREQKLAKKALAWRKAYWKRYDEFTGRRIWTYNDKGYKAGDNAEYAIRYANAQDDGIEKVFYIDPDCPDGVRMRNEGYKVLKPSSEDAVLYALHAEVVYMTHIPPYHKFGISNVLLPYFKDLVNAQVIRMYHGFPGTRSASYAQMAFDTSAVVVGTEYEKTLYTDEDNCYLPSQIIPSGMPRYDDLKDDRRGQILFAPTWRPSLAGKKVKTGASLHNPEFVHSAYYQLYNRILTDPKLLETARDHGYKLCMFLHPKLSAQADDFLSNDVVKSINSAEDMDYVTIMRQSDLMVTDYSSVQYDFAYMRKPVVYYHDPALPHWRTLPPEYEKILLGEIARSAEELVEVLCSYMESDCALKPEYRERIESFFLQKDRNSAKRLYEATRKLTDK